MGVSQPSSTLKSHSQHYKVAEKIMLFGTEKNMLRNNKKMSHVSACLICKGTVLRSLPNRLALFAIQTLQSGLKRRLVRF